jgi:ThiF family
MATKAVTILGCGVAGTWTAHHLATLGFDDFTLFGGADITSTDLTKLPYGEVNKAKGKTAEVLKTHVLALNAAATVRTFDDYEAVNSKAELKGVVGGMMGTMRFCTMAYHDAIAKGLKYATLGFPSTTSGEIVISQTPYDIDPDEHLKPTILSLDQIMVASARFAAHLNSLAT